MDIKDLEEKRNKETSGFFWLGLQIAFIFILPALVAVFFSKKLNIYFNTEIWSIICLVFSFVFSWVIVGFFYHKKSKKLNLIEKQIVELRKIEDLNKNKEN